MRQICEGVAATYDGQRMVKGRLVIYDDRCVFEGGEITREYHWGPLSKLDARRVDVAVPNTQGQRQQPALRLSNGETAQVWMLTAEMAENILRCIAQEKEIDRRVEERVAAINEEFVQMREQLARKDETIRQTSVRLQFLEEQLRAYEDAQAQEGEQTLSLMADLEAAQRRAAELQRRVEELTAGVTRTAPAPDAAETVPSAESTSEKVEFVPSDEPAPAAAETVPCDEPAPAPAESAPADDAADAVLPDDLMHMFQAGEPSQVVEPLLVTTLQTTLAGATGYNADGSNRQRIITDLCRRNRLREGQELLLVPGGDGCAVAMPGAVPEQIGCLGEEDALHVARAVDARAFVVEVTGGGPGSFLGVTLKLQLYMPVSEAAYTLPRLGEGDGTARPAAAEASPERPASAPDPVCAPEEPPRPAYGAYAADGGMQSGGFGHGWANAPRAADPFGQSAGYPGQSRQAPAAGSFSQSSSAYDTPDPAVDPFGGNKDKMKF